MNFSSKFVILVAQHELMRISQLNNCTVLRDASGKRPGQFPQFLPPASRAVDQSRCAVADVSTRPHLLVDDVVIRFDTQLEMSGVSPLVPKVHTRASSAPKLRIVRPRLAIDQPSTCFEFSKLHQLILKLIRLVFQVRSSRKSR